MAITTVKPLFIDANGVYRPLSDDTTNGNKISVAQLAVTKDAAANKTLVMDGSGNLSPALIANANIDASAAIAYSKLALTGSVVNADVSASAAIAYSKLNLATSIVNGDISASAAIAYSKLSLTGSLVNADVSASAAIAYSKLSLTGSVVNADVSASAAIAYSKLALTGSIVNADINTGAAIAYSKLNLSASIVNADVSSSAAIAYSKLNLASSITSSDVASGSGIALYAAAAPAFTNKLGVGAVTASDTTKAATVQFVLDQVAAATAGLDYKQEAKWYWDMQQTEGGQTKADTLTFFNDIGPGAPFTAGDRILLNDSGSTNVDTGIWVFGGAAESYTLTRATDLASGSTATGAWIYCLSTIGMSGVVAVNQAYVCNTAAATTGTTAIQFVLYGSGTTYTAGTAIDISSGAISVKVGAGLQVPGSGGSAGYLTVKVDDSTIELDGTTQAVKIKSLADQFKINGSATNSTVSASNLNTVTGGAATDAASLHRHPATVSVLANGDSVANTSAVYFNGTKLVAADKSVGKFSGVVIATSSGNARVATSGEVSIGTPSGSPSAGDNLYVGVSGGYCDYASLSSGDYVTKVGKYLGTIGAGSSPQLAIAIQEFGIKP